MDGTLTHAIHDFDAIRKCLKLPPGVPILEAIADLPDALACAARQQLEELEFSLANQATAQPGSHALLASLVARGARLGIVTRNGKAIAQATLQACGLAKYFIANCIVSRDCCLPKPSPAGILLLLDRWSADATDAVMVGDYLFDLQAGRSAGVTTIHMDTEARFAWPEATDAGVSSLAALSTLINDT